MSLSHETPVTVVTVTASTAPARMLPPAGFFDAEVMHVSGLSADTRGEKIADAIYGHVQAVRALGRNQISVSEIARALQLTEADVMRALPFLRTKGVKGP